MAAKTVAVIGATGLIGSYLVEALQEESSVGTIRVLVRRPVNFPQLKVEIKLIDFSNPESFKLAIDGCDAVFCTVGTTQKKVKGDKAAYRKVDYDIPVNAARFCAETGCGMFLLVSSVGADSNSNNFYLKLKGEVEDAVLQTGIKKVSIFRPSILLGQRNENRPGEKIGQFLMKAISFMLVCKFSRYKPVHAKEVAAAMVTAFRMEKEGIFEYRQMKTIGR